MLAGIALGLACGTVPAQGVFKCQKDGKTVYQAEPCSAANAGAVKIAPGPSSGDAAAARERAQADKAKLGASSNSTTSSPQPEQKTAGTLPLKGQPADCNALAAKREAAYGRRNAALAAGRQGDGITAGSSAEQKINSLQIEINSIENTMRSNSCPVPK